MIKRAFVEWSDAINRLSEQLLSSLQKDNFKLQNFAIFTGIAALLNLYSLANFSLSADDEIGAWRTDPSIWIADGRWTNYLVERFLFPQPVIPYAPNFVFCVLIAMSYMLVLHSHNLKHDWKVYITYPIYCAFPTWWLISEFYSNLPSVALGTFLSSLSVFLWAKYRNEPMSTKHWFIHFGLPAALLAFAIGAYQCLFLMYIAMGIGVLLCAAADTKNDVHYRDKHIVLALIKLAIIGCFGLIIYWLISKLAIYQLSVSRNYIDGFWEIDNLINNPQDVFSGIFNEMLKMYFGAPSRYGAAVRIFGVLTIVATIVLIRNRGKMSRWLIWLLWISFLLSPFLLNFVLGALPLRAMLAMSYIMWCFSIVVVGVSRASHRIAMLIVVVLCELQTVSLNGQYAAAAFIAQEHDRMLAADLYQRMGELNPVFDRKSVAIIDVYGTKSVETQFAVARTSVTRKSFFDMGHGQIDRMTKFMRLMGFSNVQAFSFSDPHHATADTIFTNMPTWPAKDSVKFKDNVYFIKLSSQPDSGHQPK